MTGNLTFVGTYEIPEGVFDEWSVAIIDMIDFVKANAPGLISHNVFVNEEHTEATSLYVHPDTESFEQHMEVAASRISRGAQMVRVKRIDLYGSPSDAVVSRLRAYSEASTGFPVTVKAHFYGS